MVFKLVAALLISTATALADSTVIRMGTIAPEGTTWFGQLEAVGRRIEKRTGGAVEIRAYPGAVLGDERQMVRMMSKGRLDGALLTSVGLQLAVPAMTVFHIPFLMKTQGETRAVVKALQPLLDKEYARAGFVSGGFGPVGPIRAFSKEPANSSKALEGLRVWAWVDDHVQRKYFDRLGLNTVPLSLPDVNSALAGQRIDVVYASSLGLLGFQWFPHLKYVSKETFVYSVGGVIFPKKTLDRLGKHASLVVEEFQRGTEQLSRRLPNEEDAAYEVLLKNGLKETTLDSELLKRLQKAAQAERRKFGTTERGKRILEAVDTAEREARASAAR